MRREKINDPRQRADRAAAEIKRDRGQSKARIRRRAAAQEPGEAQKARRGKVQKKQSVAHQRRHAHKKARRKDQDHRQGGRPGSDPWDLPHRILRSFKKSPSGAITIVISFRGFVNKRASWRH